MSAQKKAEDAQTLPGKEATLFRSVVRFYEGKQYKKALKAADQILKKYPEHGETLAMKGLTLNSMDKKEEAYELVRKGLKSDLKSHVCWHVYGLLYRSDRNYREAIKCYMNALRIDKENVQILRDLALLQIQMRDIPGFVDTRQALLALKPSQRNHWVSLAVAHHANKNFEVAVQVLDAFEATLDEVPANEAYEFSEILLYKAMILEEAGKFQEALELLEKSKDKVKDKLSTDVMKASLLFKLGKKQDSEKEYRALLEANPDQYQFHSGLQLCLGLKSAEGESLSEAQITALSKLYDELSSQYPRSLACKRIQLDFKTGADFIAALEPYVQHYIRKGVPSLFRDIRPLYEASPEKVSAIQEFFEKCRQSLAASPAAFPPSTSSTGNAGPESPQCLVWVLYFLAQHYDKLGYLEKALACVDEGLTHTPTLIELYTVKGKILKHSGDMLAAAHQAETARRFDLSDRYLNSAAVKALLRAGKEDTAILTAALFTKEGDSQASSLYEMQASWFELTAGAAYLRKKQYGKALKKYLAVTKHFDDFNEDQFDFHSYCIRKSTLRAYVSLLRFEDQLYNHKFFSKAALGAINCYLELRDRPPVPSAEEQEEALMASMSAEERKKFKQQKKKEERKRQQAAEDKAKAEAEARVAKEKESSSSSDKKKATATSTKAVDPDPDGSKLEDVEDPLAEAAKLVMILKEHASSKLSTHLAAFQVYSLKGRMLLALSAVQRAHAIAGASNPDVHRILMKLVIKASEKKSENSVVDQLLSESIKALLGNMDAKAYVTEWASSRSSQSLQHRFAAAETMVMLEPSAKPSAVQLLMEMPFSSAPMDHEECMAVYAALNSENGMLGGDPAKAAEWKSKCAVEFPHSTFFEGAAVLQYEPYELDNLEEAFGKLAF